VLGLSVRSILPEEHLSADTKDVVKLGIALIATMAALVLGLLIASAKSTYDTRRSQLLQVSADVILLDRLLANYGPETKEARAMLQRSVDAALEQFWPENGKQPVNLDRRTSSVEAPLPGHISNHVPRSPAGVSATSRASRRPADRGIEQRWGSCWRRFAINRPSDRGNRCDRIGPVSVKV